MYPFILAIHNILRWIVLILGLLATVMAWIGWLRKREWQAGDRKPGSFFAISADIQLLVGLLLYVFFSPLTRSAFSDFAAAMQVADLRFFALEHAVYMLLVVLFAHLGSILPRRAKSSGAKFRAAAICFSLAVLFIVIGIPWNRPLFPSF
jgi:hypothetical protein